MSRISVFWEHLFIYILIYSIIYLFIHSFLFLVRLLEKIQKKGKFEELVVEADGDCDREVHDAEPAHIFIFLLFFALKIMIIHLLIYD